MTDTALVPTYPPTVVADPDTGAPVALVLQPQWLGTMMAAPAMLTALQALVAGPDAIGQDAWLTAWADARAAIALATSGTGADR